jgi:hypothetical protein
MLISFWQINACRLRPGGEPLLRLGWGGWFFADCGVKLDQDGGWFASSWLEA